MKKARMLKQSFVYVLVLALVLPLLFSVLTGRVQAAGDMDQYDLIRERYKFLMTGGIDFDPTDPDLAPRVGIIGDSGQNHWSSMVKTPARTRLWDNLANGDNGGHVYNSFIRLKEMAFAYGTKGSALEGNLQLRDDIISGLDWMAANFYSTARTTLPTNWWEWEIGAPQQFLDAIVVMYDALTQQQIDAYMASITHYSPNVDYFDPNWAGTTGANRIWKASIVALQGVVQKSAARVTEGRIGMDPVLEYVTTGDGFYEDGSFIQHHAIPSTGSYGAELYTLLPNMMYTFEGSAWEFSQVHKDTVFRWTMDSFYPLVYNGAFMDMVRGRSVTRPTEFDFRKGHEFTRNLVLVAEFAPPELAAEMKSIVKQLILMNDQWKFFEKNPFIYNLILGHQIVKDASIQPKVSEPYSHIFAKMDRVVHRQPDFAFGISMHSERVYNYESINNENKKGWYTADGMTYLYNSDTAQFASKFWPTVDPYRLPGTTVETSLRADSSGQRMTSSASWVGGSELLSRYSSVGMELDAWEKTLTAKKSWFLFDDEMVALGAGITSSDNTTIETTVEQRKIIESNDNVFTVDGAAKPASLGWTEQLQNVSWAHLSGNGEGSDIGYYFPGTATVNALREARTGTWKDVGSSSDANPITSNYVTMWFDHGTNPVNEDYAYVVLPNKSAADMESYSSNPGVQVIANTPEVQAVTQSVYGITGANFWEAGIAGDIKAFQPASVTMKKDTANGLLTVAVSDPTQTQDSVTVEIKKTGIAVHSKDDRITVLQTAPTVKFTVNTAGAMGGSFGLILAYDPSAAPDFTPPQLSEISVTASNNVLKIGETAQLTITGLNEDGTAADLTGTVLTYSSDNETALTVNASGVVTAHASGKAVITVQVNKNGTELTKSIEISVPAGAPITVSLIATDDTFVRGGTYAAEIRGNDSQMNVANNSDENWMRHAYFKFNLEAVQGDVASAKLKLYAAVTNDAFTGTSDFKIYSVEDDSWDEGSMNWTNKKPKGTHIATVENVKSKNPDTGLDATYEVDISNYVQTQLAAGDSVISLVAIQESTANLLRIRSSEHGDPATRPTLDVSAYVYTYPLESVSLTADTSELKRGETAQLAVSGTNLDGSPADLGDATITYTSSDSSVATVTPNGLVTAVSLGSATVTAVVTLDGVTKEDTLVFDIVPGDEEILYSINDSDFSYQGSWSASSGSTKYKGDDHYSAEVNASYEVRFTGVQVSLYGSKAAHHGIIVVSVDGGEEVLVDLYSVNRMDLVKVWTSPVLANGEHILKVRVTDQRNAQSSGNVGVADRVDVLALAEDLQTDELIAVDDTYVRGSKYADTVFGAEDKINIASNSSDEYIRYGYFKFDLDSVEGSILSVKLKLYGAVTNDAFTGTSDFKLYAIEDDNWNEESMTWGSKKAFGAHIATAEAVTSKDPVTGLDSIIELDITEYVEAQKAAGDSLISVAAVQESTGNLLRIRTKEHGSGQLPPTMEVLSVKSQPEVPAEASLVLESGQTDLKIGDTATLTLTLQNAADLYGFHVGVQFDPQVFALESVSLNEEFGTEGSTAFLEHDIDEVTGILSLLGTMVSEEMGVSGDISLADIKLKAIRDASSSMVSTTGGSTYSNSQAVELIPLDMPAVLEFDIAAAVTGVTFNLDKLILNLDNAANGQLTAVVQPNGADQRISYTSSDPSVASVDGNGLVTAHQIGHAIITATTVEGGFTASIPVYVADTAAMTLDVQSEIVGYGELTTVSIGAVGSQNLTSFETTLSYDDELFELVRVELNSQFGIAGTDGASAEVHYSAIDGRVHITGRLLDPTASVSGDIGLVFVTFKALNKQGASTVELLAGASYQDALDGWFTTRTAVQGRLVSAPTDLAGNDGVMKLNDLIMVAKAYGAVSGDPRYAAGLDMNSDGAISIIDLVYVARRILNN